MILVMITHAGGERAQEARCHLSSHNAAVCVLKLVLLPWLHMHINVLSRPHPGREAQQFNAPAE